MTNQFRILLLRLTATIAAMLAGGCNMPTQQPAQPTQHTLAITVAGTGQVNVGGTADVTLKGPANSERCSCGCAHASIADCEPGCPRRAVSVPGPLSAIRESKPVVEMLTDFDDGQCGACDLAWSDWKTNGKDWPFVLVKRRGTGGRTSPTFLMPGREPWSPQTYSTGGLIQAWKSKQ